MRAITSPPIRRLAAVLAAALLSGCGQVWNDPYPAAERGGNILYTAFSQRPKHLDPVQSYSEDEATFLYQIYEPPLQYHYLKRPYTLIPGSAAAMPEVRLFDARGQRLPDDAPPAQVAYSEYDVSITPGIRFQPHPAFALDASGQPRYQNLDREALSGINTLADFTEQGTRELTADDFIYGIKRLAHPRLHSPIYGMMAERIVGLKALGTALREAGHDVLAVEMEGAAVAQVCLDYGVPFAAVRTISDRADDNAHVDFPAFVQSIASRYALEIIQADAFDFAPKHLPAYDVVFTDLWHDVSDGLPLYQRMKALEVPGVKYLYWIEQTLRCYLR